MSAEEYKAQGNAALEAGRTTEAIEYYTKAIQLDGANHVYYSNRSAAYLKQGDANNALEDAIACIGLQPDFSKGYSRKGAALHTMKRYNDAIAAYELGLSKFPGDPALTKGLEEVKRDKEGGGSAGFTSNSSSHNNPLSGLFGPEMMQRIALDPNKRKYLNDPDVMAKIKLIQNNPNMLTTILQDPKMMALLGLDIRSTTGMDDDDDDVEMTDATATARARTTTPATTTTTAPSSSKQSNPEPSYPPPPATAGGDVVPETVAATDDEDDSDDLLSPAERQVKEQQLAARQKKELGNDHYKSKRFEEALAAYEEAVTLDPTNMTYLSNQAAVHYTRKDYQQCIDTCLAAVAVGQAHRAPYEDRAKAYVRAARAYQQLHDLANAIVMCQKAQLETYDKDTQRLLKTLELEKKKMDAANYLSEEKAEEAKIRGNEYFRNKQWAQAVAEYEEAVKRAPKNAAIRNNLAAALCKVMDFVGAQRHIETALDVDPQYVKAWARKGDIEVYMKEYHKAQESYKKGLAIDPTSTACQEGLRKVVDAINYGRQHMSEDEKREQAAHAMADPEIQAILTDPVIQQILKDLRENPAAGQAALRDASVRARFEKLIAAGIIETR